MNVLFEFIVIGTPVSAQARRRQRVRDWINVVSAAAQEAWPNGRAMISDDVEVEVTYFYEGMCLDVDNMLKPILDGVKGVAIEDDAQVMDVKARRRNIDGNFNIRRASPELLRGFSNGEEFVYVKISEATDQEVLGNG